MDKEAHMLPILFRNARGDLDELFGDFWTAPAAKPAAQPAALDVYEEDDRYEVWLDVPGLSKSEVKLSFENDTLAIQGERAARAAPANEKLYRSCERWTGRFERKLQLPATVDGSRVSAELKDGVLRITLPKRESSKPRTISIS
jgi:HSP20 family protein